MLFRSEEWSLAFEREVPEGSYRVRLGASDSVDIERYHLGDGDWFCLDLYVACAEVTTGEWNTGALDVVSGILATLGFEWI